MNRSRIHTNAAFDIIGGLGLQIEGWRTREAKRATGPDTLVRIAEPKCAGGAAEHREDGIGTMFHADDGQPIAIRSVSNGGRLRVVGVKAKGTWDRLTGL